MIEALFTGFLLGISLILAIGAQNVYVLKQGLMKQHVFYVALFCALSDAFLIFIGVTGVSFFSENLFNQYSHILYGISSIWLFGYGLIKLFDAFNSNIKLDIGLSSPQKLMPTLSVLAIFTFTNPHVYLDTVILIGSISQQFLGELKVAFAVGASISSFVFFFTLAYGARLLAPIMQKSSSWVFLNLLIALIMFAIATRLAYVGFWL